MAHSILHSVTDTLNNILNISPTMCWFSMSPHCVPNVFLLVNFLALYLIDLGVFVLSLYVPCLRRCRTPSVSPLQRNVLLFVHFRVYCPETCQHLYSVRLLVCLITIITASVAELTRKVVEHVGEGRVQRCMLNGHCQLKIVAASINSKVYVE